MYPWMYVVLLGLVLIVYARLLPKNDIAAPKNTVVQEIEETIEHFAVEMDEQNKAILDLFTRTKQDYEVELAKLSGRMELLEKQKSELSQELNKIQVSTQVSTVAVPSVIATAAPMNSNTTTVVAGEANLAQKQVQLADSGSNAKSAVKPDSPSTLNMKTRYAELFGMHEQGKGVEAIAKKLGMNKGEVNLIIQLSRQEERSGV